MTMSHGEFLARKVGELNEEDLKVFFRILRAKASDTLDCIESANTVTLRTLSRLSDQKYWSDADKINFAKAQSVFEAGECGLQSINRQLFMIETQK